MRALPVIDSYPPITDSVYHAPSGSRLEWLHERRRTIVEKLRSANRPNVASSPLANSASRWLVRLSAGRLKSIQWLYENASFQSTPYRDDPHHHLNVTINGVREDHCPASDRALASMAVRMAAGELLDQLGRPLPLVMETHRDLFHDAGVEGDAGSPLAYFDHGDHGNRNHPIAAALRDYAHHGRQVVLMTSHAGLAEQLARVGARSFAIRGERIVHGHRPIWRAQYAPEHYVGPHPHTIGSQDSLSFDVERGRNDEANHGRVVNRDFDVAWREAYGLADVPRDGAEYRDGFYYANQYTTDDLASGQNSHSGHAAQSVHHSPATIKPAGPPPSPFFLSVDSPIDQAPSIDAVAAARLRGLSVTHVNHLMQQDSNRLADALGLADVEASTIRRWQAECRLVCRVPQLRGFDARVLVGCRITTPSQLASIHPVDLLERVEDFLATQRGQQLLLSGSSHELSRLTSWIAAANSNSERERRSFSRKERLADDHRDASLVFERERPQHNASQNRAKKPHRSPNNETQQNGVKRSGKAEVAMEGIGRANGNPLRHDSNATGTRSSHIQSNSIASKTSTIVARSRAYRPGECERKPSQWTNENPPRARRALHGRRPKVLSSPRQSHCRRALHRCQNGRAMQCDRSLLGR